MNKRYLDWFFTTNFMILSLSLLFIFYSQKERRDKSNYKKIQNNSNVISDNIFTILPIMFFNTLMLIMGYLGEAQYIQKLYSFSIGFIFFFLSFYLLYVQFANKSINGKRVFYIIAFIWSLYGIAHLFKKIPKNTSYNILDLISKNALGIFLVYELIGETSV
jgi:bacteriorhodopsin